METTKINYKSDFDFLLRAKWQNGTICNLNDYEWALTLGTRTSANNFLAGSEDGNYVKEGDAVRIVCNSHGLSVGEVQMELAVAIPDDLFPDGERNIVINVDSGIYLTQADGQTTTAPAVEVEMPLNKPADSGSTHSENVAKAAMTDAAVSQSGERILHRGIMPMFARPNVFYLWKEAFAFPKKYGKFIFPGTFTVKLPKFLQGAEEYSIVVHNKRGGLGIHDDDVTMTCDGRVVTISSDIAPNKAQGLSIEQMPAVFLQVKGLRPIKKGDVVWVNSNGELRSSPRRVTDHYPDGEVFLGGGLENSQQKEDILVIVNRTVVLRKMRGGKPSKQPAPAEPKWEPRKRKSTYWARAYGSFRTSGIYMVARKSRRYRSKFVPVSVKVLKGADGTRSVIRVKRLP